MAKTTSYPTNKKDRSIGYFSFTNMEHNEEENENILRFKTNAEPGTTDNNPPLSVYESLEEILGDEFPAIEIGADESNHILHQCPPQQQNRAKETIRRLLIKDGWKEETPAGKNPEPEPKNQKEPKGRKLVKS